MKTLYMTKGLPASGKTTWAKSKGFKRINKDDLRSMVDNENWSKENEKFILETRNALVKLALKHHYDVIVDDTNLASKHEHELKGIAQHYGAAFEVVAFTHVPLETCIERDRHRPNYVGEKVIRDMYNKYLKPKAKTVPPRNSKLMDAVIVDIDGTVAHNDGHRGWYDWDKVGGDLARHVVLDSIKGFVNETHADILFVSGRDGCCYEQTKKWLADVAYITLSDSRRLFMRSLGDMRKDAVVKREIYEREIEGKYNVLAVWDDRKSVVELWRELGFGDRLFDVGTGEDF